jgi:hypothetical protein
MILRLLALLDTLRGAVSHQADPLLENLALRRQLAVLRSRNPRPAIRPINRLFWLGLRRWWPRWQASLLLVDPATVVRRHGEGCRRHWHWKPRRRSARPGAATEIRALVHRRAAENPTWGAPRIHGEWLALGFRVGERTVPRLMLRSPTDLDARQRWRTFLAHHGEAIAAMDLRIVPTASSMRSTPSS